MPSLPTSVLWQNSLLRYFPSNRPPPTPWEQFWVCWRVVCFPFVIASALLMWPVGLGQEPSGRVGRPSFMVFQGLYTTIGYPLMVFLYDFSIPGAPKALAAFIYVIGQVGIQLFFVLYVQSHPESHLHLVRALGPVFYAGLIIVLYPVYVMLSKPPTSKPKSTTSCGTACERHESGGGDDDHPLPSDTNGSGDGKSVGFVDQGDDTEVSKPSSDSATTTTTCRSDGEALNGEDTEMSLARPLIETNSGGGGVDRGCSINDGDTDGEGNGLRVEGDEGLRKVQTRQFRAAATTGGASSAYCPSTDRLWVEDDGHASAVILHTDKGQYKQVQKQQYRMVKGRSRWWSILTAFLLLGGLFAAFFFCQWFTVTYFSKPMASEQSTIFAVIFILSMEAMNFAFKRFGRAADRFKTGGISCELAAEIFMSCFYCVFYRSLFQEVDSWIEFIALCVVHVGCQGLIYPVRMTSWYYSFSSKVQDCCGGAKNPMVDYSDPIAWNIRVGIDFGVRACALLCSSLAYVLSVTFVRYGYNRNHYQSLGTGMDEATFVKLITFQGISAGLEILSIVVTAVVTKRFVKGGILAPMVTMFQVQPMYQIFFVFTAAHIVTDVILARMALDPVVATSVPSV